MNSTACSPKIIIPDLYNRSSAVDPSFYNQPQVGKPTWGYNYPTALRRLPSDIGHHLQKRRPPSATIPIKKNAHHHRFAPTAQCEKPPKSGLIC